MTNHEFTGKKKTKSGKKREEEEKLALGFAIPFMDGEKVERSEVYL